MRAGERIYFEQDPQTGAMLIMSDRNNMTISSHPAIQALKSGSRIIFAGANLTSDMTKVAGIRKGKCNFTVNTQRGKGKLVTNPATL